MKTCNIKMNTMDYMTGKDKKMLDQFRLCPPGLLGASLLF